MHEESIVVEDSLPKKARARLLQPIIVGSAIQAAALGHSLALIRPRNSQFIAKHKSKLAIENEREAFRRAARQTSMFDEELAELEPTPYEFRVVFEDEDGRHNYQNGDWETHAMFWHQRHRTSESDALKWMSETFNEKYPQKGMAFAIGNQAKRPQTWQLLGVIRLDVPLQSELPL